MALAADGGGGPFGGHGLAPPPGDALGLAPPGPLPTATPHGVFVGVEYPLTGNMGDEYPLPPGEKPGIGFTCGGGGVLGGTGAYTGGTGVCEDTDTDTVVGGVVANGTWLTVLVLVATAIELSFIGVGGGGAGG